MALSDGDKLIFKIVAAVLIIVNLVGNSIVCGVVKRFNSMRTPMNYLLVHLAVCDMILGAFLLVREMFFGLYEHPDGITGDYLCKFLSYGSIAWVSSCAGIFTLLAIAWERYNAILRPRLVRYSIKKIKITILLSWVLGFLIGFHEILVLEYSPEIKRCEFKWTIKYGGVVDSGLWLVVAGIFPSLTMTLLYGRVVKTLWCSNNQITNVSQRSLYKSRKRVTKSVITVTVIFFVCWMPNLCYFFVSTYQAIGASATASIHSLAPFLFKISLMLILFNSSVNPFVYAIQDTRFRRCMKRFLSCAKRTKISSTTENTR